MADKEGHLDNNRAVLLLFLIEKLNTHFMGILEALSKVMHPTSHLPRYEQDLLESARDAIQNNDHLAVGLLVNKALSHGSTRLREELATEIGEYGISANDPEVVAQVKHIAPHNPRKYLQFRLRSLERQLEVDDQLASPTFSLERRVQFQAEIERGKRLLQGK